MKTEETRKNIFMHTKLKCFHFPGITLDDVLKDNNFDNAPPQAERIIEYTQSNKKIKMEWK